MELRPLGFGELFDRAITIFVRNALPFLAIGAVARLPIAPISIASGLIALQHTAAAAPKHGVAPPLSALLYSPWEALVVVSSVLLSIVLTTFASNAVAFGTGEAIHQRPVSFRSCFAPSLRRWKATLGAIGFMIWTTIKYCGAPFVPMIVAGVTYFGLAFLHVSGDAFSAVGDIVLFIVLGSLVLIAVAALIAAGPFSIALSIGLYAVVIENQGARDAIRGGLRRIFRGRDYGRTWLFSLAFFVLAAALGAIVQYSAALVPLKLAVPVAEELLSILTVPFFSVLIAVFYYDLRVREEAYDIEAQIGRLQPVAPAS